MRWGWAGGAGHGDGMRRCGRVWEGVGYCGMVWDSGGSDWLEQVEIRWRYGVEWGGVVGRNGVGCDRVGLKYGGTDWGGFV